MIKPCPFCNAEGKLYEGYPTDSSKHLEFKGFCSNFDCNVQPETVWCIFPSTAIEYWNKRT